MKFILDERAYVEELFEHKTMGKSEKISIRLLLKYYRGLGLVKEDAVKELVAFMSENMPQFKEFQWKTTINRLADLVYGNEQELFVVDKVLITKKELETILSVNDFKQQRVLFCLLVYKKVQNQMNVQENQWFNGSLSEIFKMARVSGTHGTIEAQCRMVYELKEAGYIALAKRIKSLNLFLNYIDLNIDENTEIAMEIEDFNDVVYYLYKHLGERVVQCQHCGRMIKLKKKERASRKYCNACKKIVNNEKVSRFRERQK